MASFKIEGVKLTGIAACVPKTINSNIDHPVFSSAGSSDFINTTGVVERRVADADVCTSDLCFAAAEKLLEELNWDRSEIEVLLFVSQTPDYILPVTSAILQDRLGLSKECLGLDMPLGCSGFTYGISNIASVMSAGKLRKGLLCVGDTPSKTVSQQDKSTLPLFGDAGAVAAFELSEDATPMFFNLGTDGSGYKAIMIPNSGYRNPVTAESLIMRQKEEGIIRNGCNLELDGMDVFSFGISQAPKTVNALLDKFSLNKEDVDYFVFHQANMMMNKMIAKKLKLPENKVPYSLKHFGNTSSATIPLTMITELRDVCVKDEVTKWILCGFGVGLSWGTVYIETKNLICSELVEI